MIALAAALALAAQGDTSGERLRVIVETDAGGDPDDEQSLVRFLLYVNEWDVEGILCNRARAREKENRSPERTGLGIVRALLKAYGECRPRLAKHDPRYPPLEGLWKRTVPGTGETDEGVNLVIAAVDRDDPRPVWFMNWGTDHGSAPSCLKRALDRVLQERGPEGYTKFKGRLRLSSADAFGDHTDKIGPPWSLWVDTFRPELDGRRWYHRFSAITAKAGGFDIERDCRAGHGPLGALYPVNTTHPQKEGDTMSFLFLVPTGMNDPTQPGWGSWAGRYGPNEMFPGRPYFWANAADAWRGTTHRENSLRRWAEHLQNDFKARLDWCVNEPADANHPPIPRVEGEPARTVPPGARIELDASASADPDGQRLRFDWTYYPEPGTWTGPAPGIEGASTAKASLTAPRAEAPATLHIVLAVTDEGNPPLTRYRRVVVTVKP
jgi:hypothetical protein